MQTQSAQSEKPSAKTWTIATVPWISAFLVPFLLTFLLFLNHEKDEAYGEIQRTHTMLGQETCQPGDDKKAWQSAFDSSTFFATPVGLVALGGYGCYVLWRKRKRA
jgi:hypothetical protein